MNQPPPTIPPEHLPTFILIGAAKAGSTSLFRMLGEHPDVFVSQPKEPKFFALREEYEGGMVGYARLFMAGAGYRARGEGSVVYTMRGQDEATASRIAAHLPDARLLFIARHPVARLRSNWQMYAATEAAPVPLETCVATGLHREFLADRSRYDWQLEPYRAAFPEAQLRVVFLEDLERDPEPVLRVCFRHIAVDDAPAADIAATRANETRRSTSDWRRSAARAGLGLGLAAMLPPKRADKLRRLALPDDALRPNLTRDTMARLLDELCPDAESFLARHGKPQDHWDLTVDGAFAASGIAPAD